ncbi:MAG: hypothetical protein LBV28_02225, partial [Puniceicoccales bacterium]|nr:hypothetical protein [Puniceicoccales bacterium]
MANIASTHITHDDLRLLDVHAAAGLYHAAAERLATDAAEAHTQRPAFVSLWTLVIWGCCSAVVVTGIAAPPVRFVAGQKTVDSIPATLIKVELTNDVTAEAAAPAEDYSPLPLTLPEAATPPALALPEAPLATPVADPAHVAFALPIEGPTLLVPVAQAAYAAPPPPKEPTPDAPPAPMVPGAVPQRLIYGQGQGRQPAPDYPYQAI